MQRKLLDSPVADLTDHQLAFAAATDSVDRSEFLRQLTGLAEFADHLTVQLHFEDFAVRVDILGRIGVGAINVLAWAGRNTNRRGSAHVEDLRLEVSIAVENLNSFIPAIGDVH